MKLFKNNWLYFFAIVIILFVAFFRLSLGVGGGTTDYPAHLLLSWHVLNTGNLKDISFWYGGLTSTSYQPLSFYLVASLSKLGISIITSYKIFAAFEFLLAPILIFLIYNAFFHSKKHSILAAFLFVFNPLIIGMDFLRLSTMLSIDFSLIGFYFCIKKIKKQTWIYVLASAIFFSLSFLAHIVLGVIFFGLFMIVMVLTNKNFLKTIPFLVFTIILLTFPELFRIYGKIWDYKPVTDYISYIKSQSRFSVIPFEIKASGIILLFYVSFAIFSVKFRKTVNILFPFIIVFILSLFPIVFLYFKLFISAIDRMLLFLVIMSSMLIPITLENISEKIEVLFLISVLLVGLLYGLIYLIGQLNIQKIEEELSVIANKIKGKYIFYPEEASPFLTLPLFNKEAICMDGPLPYDMNEKQRQTLQKLRCDDENEVYTTLCKENVSFVILSKILWSRVEIEKYSKFFSKKEEYSPVYSSNLTDIYKVMC